MKCKKCGREMVMYYGYWCPICNKPKIKSEPTLNLIKCLVHLEAIGYIGIRDRVWTVLCDKIRNDSYYDLCFNDESNGIDSRDLLLIKETWNIQDDCILMDISW